MGSGCNTVKLVCATKDGKKLGWLVLDLRSAKIQHELGKDDDGGRLNMHPATSLQAHFCVARS